MKNTQLKITHDEFLLALVNARRTGPKFKNLKFEKWLWESFAFDNEAAHYIPRAEQRKWPNNRPGEADPMTNENAAVGAIHESPVHDEIDDMIDYTLDQLDKEKKQKMWAIIQADARQIPLADKSVQCVVTSPPYWGLRDYGTATWAGGDDGCDHLQIRGSTRGGPNSTITGGQDLTAHKAQFNGDCPKCGATRIDSQIGLEATPEEYVAKIVAVFSEVWRVLRDDGTCWVNLGDSYSSTTKGDNRSREDKLSASGLNLHHDLTRAQSQQDLSSVREVFTGLKPKDLVGVPWHVAFALQAAGWYLRSDIIWSKPNPMPESVTDRPTKAHEYIFLLTKNQRYYFDQDAVRETAEYGYSEMISRTQGTNGWDNDKKVSKSVTPGSGGTRNIRTVWEIATQPYPDAHFATFPEEIAKRCIKAGTSEKGACAECGAPWERVTEQVATGKTHKMADGWATHEGGHGSIHRNGREAGESGKPVTSSKTLGWQPTCKHDAPTVPCIVLDPFSGAGTVPLVADKLNRRGIGLELKADYCRMAHDRCYDDAPLFYEVN